MANGAVNYLGMSITEGVSKPVPVVGGVERLDGVRDEHVRRGQSEGARWGIVSEVHPQENF